jgi:5-methylcytosine-specific restriction endonuclease McrA
MTRKPRFSEGQEGGMLGHRVCETHAFRHEPRQRLTDQQRARLFLERGGICHRCTAKIRQGRRWYDEHLIALENGGTNAWENRVLTCENCFAPKNAEDDKKAAKGRAVATACIIPPSQRQRKGRPMPGSRASGFRKRMDGTVERR